MTRKWGPEELAWNVFNVTGILPVEPEPTLYGGRGIRYIGRVEQWPRREEGWRVYARGGFPTPKLGNLYRVSTGAGSYPYAIDLSALSDMEQLAYAARPVFRKSADRRSPRRSWESYVASKKKKTRRNPADYEALFHASYGRSQNYTPDRATVKKMVAYAKEMDKGSFKEPLDSIAGWEAIPLSVDPPRQAALLDQLLDIGRRQPVWFLPGAGPLTVFELWDEIGSPSNLTRKGFQKALRKEKKEILAVSALGPSVVHPGKKKHPLKDEPQPVWDHVTPDSHCVDGKWKLLTTEDEHKAVAQEFGNCLWWDGWVNREGVGSRRYYLPRTAFEDCAPLSPSTERYAGKSYLADFYLRGDDPTRLRLGEYSESAKYGESDE